MRASLGFHRLPACCVVAIGATVAAPSIASAAEAEVTSDTAAQFYDVRSPTGETVLARRRLTTTLGVGVYDLMPRPAEGSTLGPDLVFRARLRYDADYGASGAEVDTSNYARLVPGFSRGPVDLMYGYVEGRRFANGWLGFKLGRQYVTDALGWWSFDGGQVKVTTPFYVAAEAYGGLEVRGGLPLSTPRFERDGVWRGDRSGYERDPSLYPQFQPASIAPAIGVAVESAGVSWLHGRLTYRRVYNTGASNVSDFASGLTSPVSYDGTRISSERLGYAVDAQWAEKGGVKAAIAYDMYAAKVAQMYASVDAFVAKRVTLSLDYDFYQPTFDADSIWNFFAGEPMNDFGVRAAVDATDRIAIAGGLHARMFNVQTAAFNNNPSPNFNAARDPNYYPTNGVAFDEGGNLSARYKWGQGAVGVHANGNFGDGGDRVGGDVFGEHVFETRYVATGRVSAWQWNDKLRPDRDATSLGYVAGLGYIFAPRSRALVEWEHETNRLVGQRFRLMLWLTVAVTQ